MTSHVIIGLSLILLACALGTFMVSALVAAARSGGVPAQITRPQEETPSEPSQCVYDCMIWFQEEPELVRHCGVACGVSRQREGPLAMQTASGLTSSRAVGEGAEGIWL